MGGGAVGGPVGAVAGGGLGSAGAGQLYDAAADYLMGTQERAPIMSAQTAMDAGVGAIGGPVGPALRTVGNVGARHPTLAAMLLTGGMTAANTAQTSDTAPLSNRVSAARSSEADVRARLKAAEDKLRELEKDETRYDPKSFNWSDPNAVEEAQRNFQGMNISVRDPKTRQMVPVPSDRRDGPLTRAGAAEYMRRAQEKTKVERANVAKLREDLAKATAGIGEAETLDQREISARRMQELNEPTWTESLSRPGGLLAGMLKGGLERYGLGKAFDWARRAHTDRANNLINQMGAGSVNERAGRINQFWTEGGARNPPFQITPGTRAHPWASVPDQQRGSPIFTPRDPAATTNASRLYRPSAIERGAPLAVTMPFAAGEWALGNQWIDEAQQELAAANAAIAGKQNPTEAEIQRVADARHQLARSEFLRSVGQGEFIGAVPTDVKFQAGMTKTRPNVGRAEAERADIIDLLNPQPPGPVALPPPPAPLAPAHQFQPRARGQFAGPPTYPRGDPRRRP
jgi:hypothetical protein